MKNQTTRMNATWVMAILLCIFAVKTKAQNDSVYQQNMALVDTLKPKFLWQSFVKFCSIPRCPGNETAIATSIVDLATQNNMKVAKDLLHNVVVYVPASSGLENLPPVCIQGHLDMVCQSKNNRDNIFPIKLIREGNIIRADETTLGADNGIGISAMMNLISDRSIPHGPLELFFTTQEEAGLVGAKGFDYTLLKSKIIYNVDSEEEGTIVVGCAGGEALQVIFTPNFVMPEKSGSIYKVTISNFLGGHSGAEIHLGRGNAIKVMSKLLSELKNIRLVSLSGGSAINTIPRDCEATIFVLGDTIAFLKAIKKQGQKIASLFPNEKPILSVQRTDIIDPPVFSTTDQDNLLNILNRLPDGVIRTESMNGKMVRTSNNIGSIKMDKATIIFEVLFRSSSNRDIDSVERVIKYICIDQVVKQIVRIPPWEPKFDSPLVGFSTDMYRNLFGKKIEVKTIHAGTECSIFDQKISGAQIISFGPTVNNMHTPDESVSVQSVMKFWDFLLVLIK